MSALISGWRMALELLAPFRVGKYQLAQRAPIERCAGRQNVPCRSGPSPPTSPALPGVTTRRADSSASITGNAQFEESARHRGLAAGDAAGEADAQALRHGQRDSPDSRRYPPTRSLPYIIASHPAAAR